MALEANRAFWWINMKEKHCAIVVQYLGFIEKRWANQEENIALPNYLIEVPPVSLQSFVL